MLMCSMFSDHADSSVSGGCGDCTGCAGAHSSMHLASSDPCEEEETK